MRNIALLSLLLSACAVNLAQSNPQPNVLLEPQPKALTLTVDAGVPDHVEPAALFKLDGWREALSEGFHNGFDRFYAPADGKAPSERLEIIDAQPQMILVATTHDTQTWLCTIRFQAEVVDQNGVVQKRIADTATSQPQAVFLGKRDAIVRRAIEDMYERIGHVLQG
jgi:hypothetical protein